MTNYSAWNHQALQQQSHSPSQCHIGRHHECGVCSSMEHIEMCGFDSNHIWFCLQGPVDWHLVERLALHSCRERSVGYRHRRQHVSCHLVWTTFLSRVVDDTGQPLFPPGRTVPSLSVRCDECPQENHEWAGHIHLYRFLPQKETLRLSV